MKKLIFGAFLSTLFVLFSCSEDSAPAEENSNTGSMAATIDGSSWSSINGGAIANLIEVGFGGDSQKALQIVGTASNMSAFTINIPMVELSLGSQTFSGEDTEGTLGYITSNMSDIYTSQHVSGNFTINITTLDLVNGKMSGTFSGKLYDQDDTVMNITGGTFTDVTIFSTDFYSNGTISLKRNSGQIFTMDSTADDGKFITLIQSDADNKLTINGTNSTLTSDFGIYSLNIPTNIAVGTYTLTNDGTYAAGIGNSEGQPEFTTTSGSLTISSHNGTNLVGTFNFTANNGSQTVTISNGSFNITHK